MKRCCQNCKVKKSITTNKDGLFSMGYYYCPAKKKKIRPTEYDNKCGAFVPYMTDDEVKDWWEHVRKLCGWPSKKQRGRTYQLKCSGGQNDVHSGDTHIKFPENSPIQWDVFMLCMRGITERDLFVTRYYYNNLTKDEIEYLERYYGKKLKPYEPLQM